MSVSAEAVCTLQKVAVARPVAESEVVVVAAANLEEVLEAGGVAVVELAVVTVNAFDDEDVADASAEILVDVGLRKPVTFGTGAIVRPAE